jgi:hypothetical protein
MPAGIGCLEGPAAPQTYGQATNMEIHELLFSARVLTKEEQRRIH